jgi:hypothetical protein
MSIEYGYIVEVQFRSKEDSLFFVEKVSSEGLSLLTQEGDKVWIPMDDPDVLEMTVVYIPPKPDYASIHHLYVGNWVKVIFEDETIYGKIVRIGPILEIEAEEMYYIPVRDGLPEGILRIEGAAAPMMKREKVEIPEELPEEEEEEEEEDFGQLFYTMDQKKSELTEALLQNVVKQSQTILKQTFLQVRRFQELFEKYTQFEKNILLRTLPKDPYRESILHNTNPFYIPMSEHIRVKHRAYEKDPNPDYYFAYQEPADIYDMYVHETIKEMPYEDFIQKEARLVQSYDIKKNRTAHEQYPSHHREVYLPGLVKYKVNEHFVTDSFVIQPFLRPMLGSTILEKCNVARVPYFDMYFKKDEIHTIHVNPEYTQKCEKVDELTLYKNECLTFKDYVERLVPSFQSFLDCYLHSDFVNFAQAFHELEYLKVDELNAQMYAEIMDRIRKNIEKTIATREKEKTTHLRATQTTRDVPMSELHQILQRDYSLGQRVLNTESSTSYQTSELWKEGMFDHFHYYIIQYLKKYTIVQVTDEEMSQWVEEIKNAFGKESEDKIHKVYLLEQQREDDQGKWVLQDIPKGTQRITAEEELYRRLVQEKRSSLTMDEVYMKVGQIKELGEPEIKEQFTADLEPFVHKFLIQYKIMKGQVAFVQESQKKYRWDGEEWGDMDTPISKKVFKIKDNQYNEEAFTKKVHEMIHTFESEKLRSQALAKMNLESDSHKQSLERSKRMWLKETLKYHLEKYHYYELELQKESTLPDPSPYLSLRNRILQEVSLETRYKAIQLFVEQFTKIGEDLHWYYCVVTNQKLMPVFYMELADAFLKTDDYPAALQRICDHQGELSDNNDFYVDKYSGFPIKQIQFDEEEDYNDNGFKDIFHAVVEKEEHKDIDTQNPIRNALKAFLLLMGLIPEDLESLLSLVEKSFLMASGEKKKPREQQQLYIYSILSHSLIYAQTLEGSVRLVKPYPDCPKSIKGYPLDSSSKKGLEFVCCIVAKIPKANEPWNSMGQVKVDKLMENAEIFIDKYVLPIQDIQDKLSIKREVQESPDTFPVWSLFYPRLGQVVPIQDLSPSKADRILGLSLRIQQRIHAHVSSQTLLLANQAHEPYLVNACCQGNNDVYRYMIEHAKISATLQELNEVLIPYRARKEIRYTYHMYSPENTKTPSAKITSSFDDRTIYRGLIHMFRLDTTGEVSDRLKKYKIIRPSDYKKHDPFLKKMEVLKQIPINESMFIAMLRDHAEVFEKRKARLIEDVVQVDHPLDLLFQKKDSDVYDYCMTSIEEKMERILSKVKDRNDRKRFKQCIQFYNVFRNEKQNDFLEEGMEHTHSMTQLLHNKIRAILFVFPEKILNHQYTRDNLPRHWDLDEHHIENIKSFVRQYDESLSNFFDNDAWLSHQPKILTQDYQRWLTMPLSLRMRYSVYAYIFVSLFDDYLEEGMMDYVKSMVTIFLDEDRMALNFDKKQVDFLSDMARKSETELKTERLKKLTKDARRAQNAMKDLKLGEWGVGLDKSLFQYDKNKYIDVFQEAKNIIEGMDVPDEIYGTYGLDDGENREGFDGDEYYS